MTIIEKSATAVPEQVADNDQAWFLNTTKATCDEPLVITPEQARPLQCDPDDRPTSALLTLFALRKQSQALSRTAG